MQCFDKLLRCSVAVTLILEERESRPYISCNFCASSPSVHLSEFLSVSRTLSISSFFPVYNAALVTFCFVFACAISNGVDGFIVICDAGPCCQVVAVRCHYLCVLQIQMIM